MTLNYGRCRVNSDFYLAFEDSDFTFEFVSVTVNNFPQDLTVTTDFGTIKREFIIKNVRFKTIADAESCMDKLKDLSKAGTPYKVEWIVHSTPSYFKFDGDTAYMYCFCRRGRGLTHESRADGPIFLIKQIEFVEALKT